MYDQPPPYSGIFQPKEQQTNTFDEKQRVSYVTNGFMNPNDPSKVYVPSAPAVNVHPPSSSTDFDWFFIFIIQRRTSCRRRTLTVWIKRRINALTHEFFFRLYLYTI